jgi:sodium-dependent phosphate transporter
MKGLMAIPFFFWLAGCLITMLLIWKGGNYDVNLTDAQIPGVIVAAGAAFALLVTFFLVPWIYRVVIKDDWQLKAYHIFQGPLLLRRGEVPPPPEDFRGAVRDFYEGHLTREELDARRARNAADASPEGDVEAQHEKKLADPAVSSSSSSADGPAEQDAGIFLRKDGIIGPKPEGPWYSGANLFWRLKWALFRGVDVDIIARQKADSVLSGDIEEVHARATHFDNKTEYLYTFLQILTASAASFVHGANDVANAVGPYATIFQVWDKGIVPEKAEVPVWILAFGGIGIAIGCWTYGYHIMGNLGNRITLMSPSRGFSMELGSVIAVVVATRLGMLAPLSIASSHIPLTLSARTSRLHHPVHHWCHCGCRSLQRRLARDQLAHG